ncbi:MAG: hypothetical protein D3X82_03770 [Candidatus Leucobacter sulfamidivorax]|nr:hypothetical protein [Candidatus Leucobacter sulfamidivorax]
MRIAIPHMPPLLLLGGASSLLAGALAPLLMRSMDSRCTDVLEHSPAQRTQLFEGVRWFGAGESGVTYRELFEVHLEGAGAISVVDPWIHSFRQIRLFAEFLEEVSSFASGEIHVHLTTSTALGDGSWALGQAKALIELQESFEARGVHLRVTFDETIHDRWIGTEDWTILLGKGLDIWDAATCYTRPPAERPISKKFAVTYLSAASASVGQAPGRVRGGHR